MKKFFAFALLVAIAVVGVSQWPWIQNHLLGHSVAGSAASSTVAPQSSALALSAPVAPRTILFAIDPTTSTASGFAGSLRSDVIADVTGYVPPLPMKAQQEAGVAAIPGLHLTVNLVSSTPAKTGEPSWSVSIPAVDGLPPQPSISASALKIGGALDQWSSLQATWLKQYQTALATAAAAAQTLTGIDLSNPTNSSITGALEELTQMAQSDPSATYVIGSDLLDNQATQSGSSLAGAPIDVIQACPSGSLQTCDATFSSFAAWAKANHAGTITRVDPADGAAMLAALIDPTQKGK